METIVVNSMALLQPFLQSVIEQVAEQVVERIKAEQPKTPRYYTRAEVAAILHVTLPTVDSLNKKGEITAKKVGSRVLYDANEIDKAVSERTIFKYKHNTR